MPKCKGKAAKLILKWLTHVALDTLVAKACLGLADLSHLDISAKTAMTSHSDGLFSLSKL